MWLVSRSVSHGLSLIAAILQYGFIETYLTHYGWFRGYILGMQGELHSAPESTIDGSVTASTDASITTSMDLALASTQSTTSANSKTNPDPYGGP